MRNTGARADLILTLSANSIYPNTEELQTNTPCPTGRAPLTGSGSTWDPLLDVPWRILVLMLAPCPVRASILIIIVVPILQTTIWKRSCHALLLPANWTSSHPALLLPALWQSSRPAVSSKPPPTLPELRVLKILFRTCCSWRSSAALQYL